MSRLVAVLGYSEIGGDAAIHPVCAARVARAEAEAGSDDVVLFSGWARRGRATSEAELMAAAWNGMARRHLVDRGARTTVGNAIAVGRAARRLDATDVVLVTSRWHARRASVLVRASLLGTRARLRVATSDERMPGAHNLRELAAWSLVPLLALLAARTR
jgi:uncharacterized SAM-binding protein YcdF (DUF218 family)